MSMYSVTEGSARGVSRSYAGPRRLQGISIFSVIIAAFLVLFSTGMANAQSLAFKQAVAVAAMKDKDISAFYKERDYKPIWTSYSDGQRRRAFFEAASRAWVHGLPAGRYDAAQMRKDFRAARTARERGMLEVATTRKFLQYARDIQSGILEPRRVSKEIYVKPPRRDRLALLRAFAKSSPQAFIRKLPPQSLQYQRLLKEKARLERIIGRGGWGEKVRARKLKPGSKGPQVVALRKRLKRMGYRGAGSGATYDDALERAVQLFQIDNGLNPDGVAGRATLAAINVSAQTRLQQVVVGLERQRWLNKPLGKRHILVNQADFRAFVIDNGKVTLETRVVVGKAGKEFRTPEFSDEMTHLIINPTWHVPQSIARKEYLPMLQKDPNALAKQGLAMLDESGQPVDPTTIDYSQFDQENFPFDLKQPPGGGNALGVVKFMFPNRFNVYLHDTPSKSLFGRDIRAYSHGCVRVQKPFDLAYTLLAPQTSDPKAFFQSILETGEETQVDLVKPVPIYLTYQTVWVTPEGRPNYRMDVYGRDKLVFQALQKAGVVLHAVRG